jgi:hypothetical protein
LKYLSVQTTFAKELLHVIEHRMLRCAPDKREKIDVICTDLSEILQSILKAENPENLAQDLAYIRRDDSAPSLRAPRNISLCEEPGESAADDPDTPTGDGSDTGLMMQMRSQRLSRENAKPSEGRKDVAPSTDGQGISRIPAANAIAATTQKETKDQSAEKDLGSKDTEASRMNTANSHIPRSARRSTVSARSLRTGSENL